MKLEYAGPRPFINQHGIEFLDGKDDKYAYLAIALQILQGIDREYTKDKIYTYESNTKRLSSNEMLKILLSYEPDIEKIIEDKVLVYIEKLKFEKAELESRTNIKDIEKKVWLKNLELMRNYRIQRTKNKIFYMITVEKIVDIINREGIQSIETPFYEKYWHVLQTIEGRFNTIKSPLKPNLEVISNENNKLIAKMTLS
ncbi:MAG: hypothetical protein U9Q30_01625 [Campylobacterota bacterium]|nr:hypothetical protein [Campylobacterota bacterium]